MSTVNPMETKRYATRTLIRVIAVLAFIAAVLLLFAINITFLNVGLFQEITFLWVIALINLLVIFNILVSGDIAFLTHIALSAEGIQYHFFGKTGFASWADVTKIQYAQTPRGYFEWIIRLDKALEWQNQSSKWLAKLNRKRRYRIIPLAFFVSQPKTAEEFFKTDFFKDLMYFAPHLHEKVDNPATAALIPTKAAIKLDLDSLSPEMQSAYQLAQDLHNQGKGFQVILAALREETVLDFDERIEIMDFLEAEGHEVKS